MPFVYEEDIDVQNPMEYERVKHFNREYERFVRSRNKPLEVERKKKKKGRPNFFDKLSGRERPVSVSNVRKYEIDYDLYNRFQLNWMLKSASRSKRRSWPVRGRVGKLALLAMLREEMEGRIRNYLEEEPMKKKILCIVGESGTGKTLASLHLKNKLGANVICSYTTRPPRETEVEGRDHHFVDIVPPPEELLAYTVFGNNYKYYATKAQVYGPCTVYVIDEKGLIDLQERWKDEYEIYSVYISRAKRLRRRRGVDETRMNRDIRRMKLDLSFYNYTIINESTKKCLFESIEKIYNEVKDK